MKSRSEPVGNNPHRRLRAAAGAALLGLLWALPGAATLAQQATVAAAAPFTPVQLDQMLAPVALYPDGMLGQIFMAATYPLDIVEADRWLQDPNNAALRGMPLVQALQPLPWDPSVKALVAFPQVLSVLDSNLDWTEQLGEAFLAQQRDVMDHVQQLRSRAQAARTLVATPQQQVSVDGQAIEIAPASPDSVYVPVYDPNLVYGSWPYPDAAPYYFDMGGYFPGTFVAFAILPPLWGWDQWDWHNHGLLVSGPSSVPGAAAHPPVRHVPWRHDPQHRGTVRYASASLQARYGHVLAAHAPSGYAPVGNAPGVRAAAAEPRAVTRTVPPAMNAGSARPLSGEAEAAQRRGEATPPIARGTELPRSPGPAPRPAPPAAERPLRESPIRGPEERAGEAREGSAGAVRDRR
jgi:hypothetical protein